MMEDDMPEDEAHDDERGSYLIELPKYLYEELQDYLAAEDRTISAVVEEFIHNGLHVRSRDTAPDATDRRKEVSP